MLGEKDLNNVCNIEAIEMMREIDRSNMADARALRWLAHQNGSAMIEAAERHEAIARTFRGAADRLAALRVPVTRRTIGITKDGKPGPGPGLSEEIWNGLLVAVRNGTPVECLRSRSGRHSVGLYKYQDPYRGQMRWAVDYYGAAVDPPKETWFLEDFVLEFDARTRFNALSEASLAVFRATPE